MITSLEVETDRLAPVRRAFIERRERMTYKELSEEFKVPLGTICNAAADQSWPAMRSDYLAAKLVECDAQSALLAAVQTDKSLLRKFTSVALSALDKLALTIDSINVDRAANTNASALNTCSFAYLNFARGLSDAGILGISKTLNASGKEDNGRWNPQMLSQINVTVQNLAAQAEKAEKTVEAVKASAAPKSPDPSA
jgi:hypothetical protein